MPLITTIEALVVLDGYLDSSNSLQFRYGEQELSEHDDHLEVIHDGDVRVALRIPQSLPSRVEHEDDDGPVHWEEQDGEHSCCFLPTMTDAAEVNVMEAGEGTTHHKTLHIKVTPKGGLPER